MTHKEAKKLLKALKTAHYHELQVPQVVNHLISVLEYLLKITPHCGEDVKV
jgi:hypothetical protein